MVISTRRTEEEQRALVAVGKSLTYDSKHLRGLALDVCLFDQYQLHGPDRLQWTSDPTWDVIGDVADQLHLRWGGRFRTLYDPGHVEMP